MRGRGGGREREKGGRGKRKRECKRTSAPTVMPAATEGMDPVRM